jgi:hypothetical protein
VLQKPFDEPGLRIPRPLLARALNPRSGLDLSPLEQDQEVAPARAGLAGRDDPQVDLTGPAIKADPLASDRSVLVPALLEGEPDLREQVCAGDPQEIEARLPGGRLEVRAGLAAELQGLNRSMNSLLIDSTWMNRLEATQD